MVKIQPLEPPEPPTKFDFLEYLDDSLGLSQFYSMDYLYFQLYDHLVDYLEWFQSRELSMFIFEEYFDGDWRQGQEISKIVITQRLYQISPSSTQA